MIITIREIFDIVLMSVYLGIIFSFILKRFAPRREYDPLERKTGVDWKLLKFSILLIAPAVVLHELAHKFVAMGFGLEATFYAFYATRFTLVLGILALIMALGNFGFIFIVPGFVSISSGASPLVHSLIAFSGPAMNLLLWLGTTAYLKYGKVNRKYLPLILLTKKINMFLFIFNMIPFPGFDGSKVFAGLLQTIF
jgi:Zn-dependent protease